MIGNLLNIFVGLWLAYSSIFATPAGNMNNGMLAGGAVVAIICAAWARRSDRMRWPSATNIVLGVVLLAMAAARLIFTAVTPVCFWVALLAGIAIAIMAMWSMLYRPELARAERPISLDARAQAKVGA